MSFYKLIQGDCLKVLPTLDEGCIDCIVTDPPYGMSFMGKDWDKALPPKEAFREMYRVLKAGALAFVMSSSRQDLLWRMMALLESVGFELRQSPLYWAYASGFPKAYDVSKGIDKRKGGLIDKTSLGAFIKKHRENTNLSRQDASELVTGNRTGAFWNWENNYCLPLPELWIKIKEVIKAPDSIWDDKLSRAEREIIGRDKSFGLHDSGIYELNKQGLPPKNEWDVTKSKTDLAQKWDGWKSQTGLKPAVEVILMANKPRSEKTIVDQVLATGTGAVNVDACRIPFNSAKTEDLERGRRKFKDSSMFVPPAPYDVNNKGRFPANLLVSSDVLDSGRIHKSGKIKPHHTLSKGDDKGNSFGDIYGKYKQRTAEDMTTYGDSGGFSRFFSLDAWAQKTYPFLITPKASKSERDEGLDHFPLRMKTDKRNVEDDGGLQDRIHGKTLKHNFHPTVKPLKLMTYLVTLGCPPNGMVLDPYVGSGTTMIASYHAGMSCIGIELNPEYCSIVDAKMRHFTKQRKLNSEVEYVYEDGQGLVCI